MLKMWPSIRPPGGTEAIRRVSSSTALLSMPEPAAPLHG